MYKRKRNIKRKLDSNRILLGVGITVGLCAATYAGVRVASVQQDLDAGQGVESMVGSAASNSENNLSETKGSLLNPILGTEVTLALGTTAGEAEAGKATTGGEESKSAGASDSETKKSKDKAEPSAGEPGGLKTADNSRGPGTVPTKAAVQSVKPTSKANTAEPPASSSSKTTKASTETTKQPETTKAASEQPETTKAASAQPETTKAASVQPETTKAASTQPQTTQPASTQPETKAASNQTAGTSGNSSGQTTSGSVASQEFEDILGRMTLEEKIYQLFIVTPEAWTGYSKVTTAEELTKKALSARPVAGVVYFDSNLLNPNQFTQMLSATQAFAKEAGQLPLLLAIDEEGGKVARIANKEAFPVKKFPNMRSIGERGDTEEAYNVGAVIGDYLRPYGINLDFAPNSDVLTNSKNTVIGDRSFGTDPQLVAKMSLAVASGLKDKGVLPTLKHFPGHGATLEDTHNGLAVTNKTYEEMLSQELVPFIEGIKQGIPLIMVAHISAPKVTGDNTPSSLSPVMIRDILRGKLGYRGIVITDALNMGAITDQYDSATAAVMAVQAGVDILLMPNDLPSAHQGILAAVRDGRISEARIDESLRRILQVKVEIRDRG